MVLVTTWTANVVEGYRIRKSTKRSELPALTGILGRRAKDGFSGKNIFVYPDSKGGTSLRSGRLC